MARKNVTYKEKMKELRGLVSFDYDLRKPLHPRSKGKINAYWDELQEAKGQAYRVYRPRSKANLNIVKKATGFGNGLKDFNVAIIPNHDPQNPFDVKINNGQLTLKSKYSDRRIYLFNQGGLIDDSKKEITRVLNKIPKDHFKSITAGKFEVIGRTTINNSVHEKVIRLMNQYSNEAKNNYWGNWMHGIIGIKIKDQKMMDKADMKRAVYKTSNKKNRQKLLRQIKNDKKKNNRNG